MKQIKTLLLAQILFMGIFLSSCMESGDYTPTGGGVVEVLDRYGYTYFKDFGGVTIDPLQNTVSSVESSMGFKPAQTKIAYILYSYPQEGNEALITDKKINNATLTYAVALDAKTERVATEGAANDSINTAPIIRLRSLMSSSTDSNDALYLHNGRYLMTGAEYYFSFSKQHHLTMVYYPEEQVEGKLILHLRHSGDPEAANVYTTSYGAFQSGYPYVYIKSFDLSSYMPLVSSQGELEIEVHAMQNLNSNKLEEALPVIYKLTHKFNQEN